MKARIISPQDLGPSEVEHWQALRAASPFYASPFFSPRFTQLIGDVRTDVRVAVIEDGPQIVGFFPYHAAGFGLAHGLAAPISNGHGPVLAADCGLGLADLVQLCGLAGYGFGNLPIPEWVPDGVPVGHHTNYVMDLSDGAGALIAECRAAHPGTFKKLDYYERKAQRAFADIAIEVAPADPTVSAQLLAAKQAQYARTRSHDILKGGWIRSVYERLLTARDDDLYGLMACLRFDGQIVATSFDVVSGDYAFAWLTAYDLEYKGYSPGNLLSLGLLPDYARRGIRTFDFGIDYGHYKDIFANHTHPMLSGFVPGARPMGQLVGRALRGISGADQPGAGRLTRLAAKTVHSLSYVAVCEPNWGGRLAGLAGRVTSRFTNSN